MTDAKTSPYWITGTVPVDANGEPFAYGFGLNPQLLTDIRDAEIARLRAELFDLKEQLRTSAAAAYKVRLDANAAEAERDAARAHNADLSATLEARVQAARVKALEDAAEAAESMEVCRSEYDGDVAAAIRNIKELKNGQA